MKQAITLPSDQEQFDLGVQTCYLVLYKPLCESEIDYQQGESAILTYSYSFDPDQDPFLKKGQLARGGSVSKGSEALPWKIVGIDPYLGREDSVLKGVIIAWCRRVGDDTVSLSG
jgi:hypothetical protein